METCKTFWSLHPKQWKSTEIHLKRTKKMSTMSINKLTLQQAMETLKTMFPSISPEVLKTNLYRTNGRMEDTIEILLQMQTSPRDPQLDEPRMDLVARREDDFVPHSLPPDFLCYDFDDLKLSNSSHTANDEQLAVRLQRQMILEGMGSFLLMFIFPSTSYTLHTVFQTRTHSILFFKHAHIPH